MMRITQLEDWRFPLNPRVLGLALIALLSSAGSSYSQQIAPNPNPAGNVIAIALQNFNGANPLTNFSEIDNSVVGSTNQSGAAAVKDVSSGGGTVSNLAGATLTNNSGTLNNQNGALLLNTDA